MNIDKETGVGSSVDPSAPPSAPDLGHFLSTAESKTGAAVVFETLFQLDEIQRIQDEFSSATGVASIITRPDGTPLTKPSNFTRLCSEIIRKTEKGCANCYRSDATIGRDNASGPIVQPCMSGGLWDAGASITVDGHHIANWLIGQVRDETQTDEQMRAYAHAIGAEESSFIEAFAAVPAMSRERFNNIAKVLFSLANQLSTKAFLNVQQRHVIAELQVLQKTIQDSETYNKTLFADSYIALVVLDPDAGTFIDGNRAAQEIFRLPSRDALIGLTPLDVSATHQYDGTESAVAARYRINQALSKGSEVFEWRHRRMDGQEWDAEVQLMSFVHGGRTLLQFSVQDITERNKVREALRASEENLSTTLHSIGDAVIVTDTVGRVSRMNATAERLSGWTLADALDRPLTDVFHIVNAETRESVPDPVQLVMASGHVVGLANHTVLLARDGKECQIADSAAPIRNAKGDILGVVLVFSDVSDKYLAEQALRDSEKRFKALHDASFGGISIHEKGVILDCNQGLSSLTGFSKDELVGMDGVELIAPEWRDEVRRNIGSGFETHYEVEGLRKDGSRYPMIIQGKNIPFQGRTVRVTEFRDITKERRAEESVKKTEAIHRKMMANIGDVIVIIDRDGINTFKSANIEKWFGWKPEELVGQSTWANVHPDDLEATQKFFRKLAEAPHATGTTECRYLCKDGSYRWIETTVTNLLDDPDVLGLLGNYHDITDRKLADEALQISENQFREIFDEAPIGYHQFDAEGRITRVNRTELASLGYTEGEMLGHYVWEFNDMSEFSNKAVLEKLAGVSMPSTTFERNFLRKDGTTVPMLIQDKILRDKAGKITGIRSVVMDITERKRAEEKINHLAFFDQLTDLPNRRLLQDRLKQAMASGMRSGSYGALLLIDLDYFKTLNDTLGHDMGDLLLKQVARRLSECVREEDTVSRLGGDEFVVMLVTLSENRAEAASQVELIGRNIIAALNQTYELREVSYDITSSIGASVFVGQQTDIDTLLKQADLAMYKAKNAGRNSLRFFDPDMARDVLERASLDNDLREALNKKQYLLHYQAQVAGSRVTGAEVLLRWQHPSRGMVFPGEFISVIEETGLILPVGQWVLESACKQLADWATQAEMSHLTVAVNISARQFSQEGFVDQVMMALDRSGANPQRLKLELTESLLVNNVEDIIGKMTALKLKGVGFSLDDFGTGYSSLAYLKRLPLDQLKIDQSFVRDILVDPNDAAIAKMIVVLSESLGLAVIAEGVETEAQRDSLTLQGCHAYQGYFFSRPLPLEEFEAFVKRA